MLLFISRWMSYTELIWNFNTSHVTVYPSPVRSASAQRNFNTSHVTVYLNSISNPISIASFQYISCYCLSDPRILRRNLPINFNTSHVTVYLNFEILSSLTFIISIHLMLLFIEEVSDRPVGGNTNFNTSHVTVYHRSNTSHTYINRFQYISCYCLSVYEILYRVHFDNFNTSHVTVYHRGRDRRQVKLEFQYISCYCLS